MSPPVGLQLIGSGMAMGVVHVLTGPDHLSALATLSANVGNCQAFSLGVRWGIGHSSGLLLVGVFLIAVSQGDKVDMPSAWSSFFESFVGIFMLLLGAYSVRKAIAKRPETFEEKAAIQSIGEPEFRDICKSDDALTELMDAGFAVKKGDGDALEKKMKVSDYKGKGLSRVDPSGAVSGCYESSELGAESEEVSMSLTEIGNVRASCGPKSSVASATDEEAGTKYGNKEDCGHVHHIDSKFQECLLSVCNYLPMCNRCKPIAADGCSTKVLALCIGIVHGFAGPGGVLGVIPAVHLHDWRLATIYLGTFCATSTVVMGCFAALYGTCSERLSSKTHLEFHMACFSATLSIVVGLLWIVLLSIGKLDDIFP